MAHHPDDTRVASLRIAAPATLHHLLARNAADLRFWKERGWNSLRLTSSAVVGLMAAALVTGYTPPGFWRWVAFGLPLVAAGVSHVYQLKVYRRHEDLVYWRRRIEDALGCHQPGFYGDDEPLLAAPDRADKGSICSLVIDALFEPGATVPASSKVGTHLFVYVLWILALLTALAMLFPKG